MTSLRGDVESTGRGRSLVDRRRDFHEFAERGWCEVRTASLVARELADLGFDVGVGRDVVSEDRMGLPTEDELAEEYRRAVDQGADPEYAPKLAGGFTGVVGTLRTGRPGPVVALRFDIDANQGFESAAPDHVPAALGFASVNRGVHHSCGHDAHTAIGLAVAEVLAGSRRTAAGEVRLIFQPAEEGLRGGPAMVTAGVVDGVDHFLGCHIGVQARRAGEIVAGYRNILASLKFDARFTGKNAHAGISPHEGRNAVQAAAIAVQNLLATSRHGDGETRVNVGQIAGGETRNSIPAHAVLRGEIRADTSEILRFLEQRTREIVEGAAMMCGVDVAIEHVGGADGATSDAELAEIVASVAADDPDVVSVRAAADFKGSDDASSFMNAVQAAGGTAVYFGLGSDLPDVHHAPSFDVDEAAMPLGVRIFVDSLRRLQVLA